MAFEPTPLSEANPTTLVNAGYGNLGQVVPGRNTFNTDVGGQLIPEERYCYDEAIYLKNGDEWPLCWALQQLGTETGWDNYIIWSDDVLLPQIDDLAGSLAADAAAVTVTNAGKFGVNDLVQDEHRRGQWLVTAVNYTTNVLTLTELNPPPAGAPLVPGDKLIRIGTAHREAAGHSPRPTTVRVDYYNRYADHRLAVQVSDSHAAGNFSFIPGDPDFQKQKLLKTFNLEKEKMILFGKRAWNTVGNNPLGVLRGLFEWPTNTYNVATLALTRAVWEEIINDFVRVSADNPVKGEWLFLCAGPVQGQVSDFFTPYDNVRAQQTVFGFACQDYITREGVKVHMVVHPLLNTHNAYNWQHDALLLKMDSQIEKLVYHRVTSDRMGGLRDVNIPWEISIKEWVARAKFSLRVKASDINMRLITNIGGF